MGKSACVLLLRDRGVPVVDTDDLAREVVQPGQPALKEIESVFGSQVLGPDGTLQRKELAQLVFKDPEARRQLEEILHPKIRQLWRSRLQAWSAQGHPLGVVVIPLLFETQAEKEMDQIICVACSSGTQRQRLSSRGWSAEQIEQRIQAQLPVEKKMALSSYVIWTEAGMDLHAEQLDRILTTCGVSSRRPSAVGD